MCDRRRDRKLDLALKWAFGLAIVLAASLEPASAQAFREPAGGALPPYARKIDLQRTDPAIRQIEGAIGNGLPNIMLTGYWPPTNEMIRRFSTDPVQNPQGWIGGDWEERGYNVLAFFPEFPFGLGKGEGDFEVDYQDTSDDFWLITSTVNPVTIITFGRAYANNWWELEWRNRNLSSWAGDYESPYQPTPSPPDGTEPADHIRYAALPMQAIADAVNSAAIGLNTFVDDTGDSGGFLCEYIGYHASWFHDLHADPGVLYQTFSAGHVHVGSAIDLDDAIAATEISVRTLIDYLGEPLLTNRRHLYAAEGGVISFDLTPGIAHANRDYLLCAGLSGTAPGTLLPGGLATIPLNRDWFTDFVLARLNTQVFAQFAGALDPAGLATATLNAPPFAGWTGTTIYFAFGLSTPQWDYASNAVEVRIVP